MSLEESQLLLLTRFCLVADESIKMFPHVVHLWQEVKTPNNNHFCFHSCQLHEHTNQY